MTNLHQKYDPPVVLLSFGVSFLGAYVGISLAEIFRVKVIDTCKNTSDQGFIHYFYLFLMALSLGGVAIWCMHFIGMQAVSLHHPIGGMVSMEFNFGLSMASLIAVVFTVFAGLVIASRDRMFCKTKTEIIEMFMDDAKKLSIAEIRKITATRMLVLIATKELGTLVAGGVTTSAGVCIMHYIGMASMVFDGQIHWNAGIVALSVVIAMVASTAAFWILFRLLSIFPEMEWLRMASAFIMAVAVNGMHYTGMVAAEFVDATGSHRQGHDLMGDSVSDSRSFIAVLIVANVVLWLMAHAAFSSSRESVNEKSKRLREAQEVFRRMAEATANGHAAPNTIHRLLEHYLKKEAKRKQAEQAKALASVSHTLYVRCMGLLGRTGVAPEPDGASVMSFLSGVSGVGNDSQINNSRISAGSHPKVGSRGKASDKTDAQSNVSHVSRESGGLDAKMMPLAVVESTSSVAEEEISPAEMV